LEAVAMGSKPTSQNFPGEYTYRKRIRNIGDLIPQSVDHTKGSVCEKQTLMTDSSLGLQQSSNWGPTALLGPTELIPCDWQFQQNKRQKRNPKGRDSRADRRRSSAELNGHPIPSLTFRRTALKVGDEDRMRKYYEKAFDAFQQLNCRVIAKAFIKLVEPRKQVNHPYNGRKPASGSSPEQRPDPELTKPKWWPSGVTHKEPDHLLKAGKL